MDLQVGHPEKDLAPSLSRFSRGLFKPVYFAFGRGSTRTFPLPTGTGLVDLPKPAAKVDCRKNLQYTKGTLAPFVCDVGS